MEGWGGEVGWGGGGTYKDCIEFIETEAWGPERVDRSVEAEELF